MANTTIEIKYSQVSGNTPSSLANGEISINTADGKLFYKSASGTITPFLKYPGPAGLNGEIQFNDSGVLGSTANLSITKANGSVTLGGTVKAAGATGESAFISNGSNGKGGAGYHGFLEANNTTASNGAKFFRINSTGGMEIVNSGYTATIMSLSNAGDLLASGAVQTGNYIQFADGSKQYTANAVGSGAVTSVAGATGAVSNTQLINAVTSTNQITFNSIVTSNNGLGTNFRIGDDAWLGDVNVADTVRLAGLQNSANAWLRFGSTGTEALGRAGAGPLLWGANTVWHSGNQGIGSGLDADLLDGLTGTSYANSVYDQAGFDKANTAQTTATAGFAAANTAQTSASAAFNAANTAQTTATNALSNTVQVLTVNSATRIVVANTTATTSNVTGALVVAGGIATQGNIYSTGGTLVINNGLATTGNSGTLVLGDGSITKTYGSGWTWSSGITTPGLTISGSNYIDLPAGSNTIPSIKLIGSSGTGLYFPFTGVFGIAANSANGLFVSAPTGGVNYAQITGNVTTGGVTYGVGGTDSNIDAYYIPKGTGASKFSGPVYISEAGNITRNRFQINPTAGGTTLNHADNTNLTFQVDSKNALVLGYNTASAVNYLQINNSPTGNSVSLSAQGSDANVDVSIIPKGSAGKVNISSTVASTSNTTGALVISGGLGVSGNVYAGNVVSLGTATATRFISTQATGTAPFDVTSTTVVTNLNADLLDGLNSTSFANSVYDQAGFDKANTAQTTATAGFTAANTAQTTAAAAFNAANNATSNGFGVISVTGGGQLVAATPNTILNITAGSGISITTNNTSKTITLAAAATATGTFVDGADFTRTIDAVGVTNDLAGVSEAASITINLGSLTISGILTPSTLIAPSYNAGSLPSATRAAQIAFVPDDTGGAIMVFSDGTNWRRFTDRTIIV
jgi:hypothetical protein